MNENYSTDRFILSMRDSYRQMEPYEDVTGAKFHASPTPTFVLPNMFQNEFIDLLQQELLKEQFVQRHNDLYKFQQSGDIKISNNPVLKEFRASIYSDRFVNVMSEITGIKLSNKVDISGQRYKQGDHLLCHDDELEGRRIAFIIYLVDDLWSKNDGGTLDFFKTENEQPVSIELSIVPKRNSFCFFVVSKTSFHQVSEILTSRNERVSIGGWFHIDPMVHCLEYWLNPIYLSTQISSMKQVFVNEASLQLTSTLNPSCYEVLLNELNSKYIGEWKSVGPMNYRNYFILQPKRYIPFVEFCKSKIFSQYISNIVGWNYKVANVEVRKFVNGSYTLLHDNYRESEGLDLYWFVGSLDQQSTEGKIFYQSNDQVLLEIEPATNALAMVLRDSSVSRFVKYINHLKKFEMIQIWISMKLHSGYYKFDRGTITSFVDLMAPSILRPTSTSPISSLSNTKRLSFSAQNTTIFYNPELPSNRIFSDYSLNLLNFTPSFSVSRIQKVKLFNIYVDKDFIEGLVSVDNESYSKTVMIRYSTNVWKSFFDLECKFERSLETNDLFKFQIPITENKMKIFFAIRFTVNGNEYWDNNWNSDYAIEVEKEGEVVVPLAPIKAHTRSLSVASPTLQKNIINSSLSDNRMWLSHAEYYHVPFGRNRVMTTDAIY